MNPNELPTLRECYFQTDYRFTYGRKIITIRLETDNLALKKFLEEEGIESWAYITAWNPHSLPMPEYFNRKQQGLLREKVKSFQLYEGEGKGLLGDWPPEESFFIAGIGRWEACELGREFGQNAILLGNEKGEAVLKFFFP